MWATPAWTTTLGASRQLTSNSQPRNLEPFAARASSLTSVPIGKNTLLHAPEVVVGVNVQFTPAGWEVTVPAPHGPTQPRAREMLPRWSGDCGTTVNVADLLVPPPVAVMVTDRESFTAVVLTVKVPLVAPAGTVTLAGTLATAGLLLDSDTTSPPEGAAAVNVTVPVTGLPPTTFVWLSVSDDTEAPAGGGGGELTVQPARRAVAAVADPSLTSTVQSAGAVKPDRSTRNRPSPALDPIATPSTVMVRFGAAVPSMRKFPPLTSARDTLTVA
jgi:hypothetical protein